MAMRNQNEQAPCPYCGNYDKTMMTLLGYLISEKGRMMLCEVCTKAFKILD